MLEPAGTLYVRVQPSDVEQIVATSIENGGVVADPTCYQTTNPGYNPAGPTCLIGTRDSHWENSFFTSAQGDVEIMSGFIPNAGTPMPLSATTLASLHDLGYSVDMAKAEAFSVDLSGLRALTAPEPGLDLSGDVLQLPVRYADDTLPVD